jgi:hypothetical protein
MVRVSVVIQEKQPTTGALDNRLVVGPEVISIDNDPIGFGLCREVCGFHCVRVASGVRAYVLDFHSLFAQALFESWDDVCECENATAS